MRTLIVLVNWRRAEDTIACIDSLRQLGEKAFDVSVCDNSPSYETGLIAQYLRSIAEPQAGLSLDKGEVAVFAGDGRSYLLVNANANLGFAGGNNLAFAAGVARPEAYDYYWFLNNDTEVPRNCLSELLNKMARQPRAGICGATLLYGHDRHLVQATGGAVYRPWLGLMHELGNRQRWPLEVDESRIEAQITYVVGASMFVRKGFVDAVGLMAEDYFLYFEELDWAVRGRKKGFDLAYASEAIVYHKEGVSIGTGKGVTRSQLAEYFGLRNKLLITVRFYPLALLPVWLISWLQVARRLASGRYANAWLMAKVLLGLGGFKKPA